MKETIIQRFNNYKKPELGAIVTLNQAVRGMRYGKQKVIDAFNKLVPKGEYENDEKDEILESIIEVNNEQKTL